MERLLKTQKTGCVVIASITSKEDSVSLSALAWSAIRTGGFRFPPLPPHGSDNSSFIHYSVFPMLQLGKCIIKCVGMNVIHANLWSSRVSIDRDVKMILQSIRLTISLTLHVTLLTSNGGGRRQREMTDTFYSLFTRVAFLSSFLLVLNRLR